MPTIEDVVKSAESLTEEDRGLLVVEVLKRHSLLGVSRLIKSMDKEFGVTAAVMAAPAAASGAQAPSADAEKTVDVIKVIRQVTSLGLKEAKALVDTAPQTVKEAAGKEEAEKIKKDLEAVGAKVELS